MRPFLLFGIILSSFFVFSQSTEPKEEFDAIFGTYTIKHIDSIISPNLAIDHFVGSWYTRSVKIIGNPSSNQIRHEDTSRISINIRNDHTIKISQEERITHEGYWTFNYEKLELTIYYPYRSDPKFVRVPGISIPIKSLTRRKMKILMNYRKPNERKGNYKIIYTYQKG